MMTFAGRISRVRHAATVFRKATCSLTMAMLAVGCSGNVHDEPSGQGSSTRGDQGLSTVDSLGLVGQWRLADIRPSVGRQPTEGMTADFKADGLFVLADFCNGLTGKWTVLANGSAALHDVAMSTRACSDQTDYLGLSISASIGPDGRLSIMGGTHTYIYVRSQSP